MAKVTFLFDSGAEKLFATFEVDDGQSETIEIDIDNSDLANAYMALTFGFLDGIERGMVPYKSVTSTACKPTEIPDIFLSAFDNEG